MAGRYPAPHSPPPRTLLDLFHAFAGLRSECLQYDNGYRSWRYTWTELAAAAHRFAERLAEAGLGKGDRVLFWSENRPEWVAAFWGCVLAGIIIVPVDYRSSAALVMRIRQAAGARLLLLGEEVHLDPGFAGAPVWRLAGLDWPAAAAVSVTPDVRPGDIAEIVFTSGATGEPKGVVLTHRNILADLEALADVVRRYGKWFRPLAPLRFLGLIPLSHMFGQMLTLFFLPLVPASAVLMRGYSPHEIIRQIHRRKVSVVIAVPKLLEVLRDALLPRFPEISAKWPSIGSPPLRWWRFRHLHRLLGWRFWAFAVGAAPLAPELERFWARLGIAIIQGYGLTETSPIVAFNNPFDLAPGTVGKPIAGMEMKIAPDGEVLVRGANVTPGYYQDREATAAAFTDGWFHTGDLGSLDDSGNLSIHGRKKELIVTPEGLNVVPEDVEQVLDRLPGVREAAVVGHDRVHAVLVLQPGADVEAIVREANRQLEDHQKIRGYSVWPEPSLPRTEGTRKLRHAVIRQWVESGEAPPPVAATRQSPLELLRRYAPGRTITPETTLDELGLSSLDRVGLLMDLEQQYDITLDETQLTGTRTVGELTRLAGSLASAQELPRWSRTAPARLLRRAGLSLIWLPLTRVYVRARVSGRQHMANLTGPVIFAANHQSHFDTPAILNALPPRYRFRIVPAMWKEYFEAHFSPEKHGRLRWLANSTLYGLVTLFFNTVPVPQTETGASQSLRFLGECVSEGWSILYFPEGERSVTGAIGAFQPGIGLIASRLQVPVVPIRLRGLEKVLQRYQKWPRRGHVEIAFGAPLQLAGEDYARLTQQVEEAVRGL